MGKYIKSHSNYVINKKHQITNEGTIYERDITTIGGRDQFAPGQIPIYRSGNFVITTNGEVQNSYKVGINKSWKSNGGDFNDVWTLDSIAETEIDETSSNDNDIVIKQDIHNLTDFAYWGSCSELFRVSIGDILNRYPGEFYLPYNNLTAYTRTWSYRGIFTLDGNEVAYCEDNHQWYDIETGEVYTGQTSAVTVNGTDIFYSVEDIKNNGPISACVKSDGTVDTSRPYTISNRTSVLDDITLTLPNVTYRFNVPNETIVGITPYYNKYNDPHPFRLYIYRFTDGSEQIDCYRFIDNDGNYVYYIVDDFQKYDDTGKIPQEVEENIYLLDNPLNLDMLRVIDSDESLNPLKYLRTNDNYKNYELITEDGEVYGIKIDVNFLSAYIGNVKLFKSSPLAPTDINISNVGNNEENMLDVDTSGEFNVFGEWSPGHTYCPGELLAVINLDIYQSDFETTLRNFDALATTYNVSPNASEEENLAIVLKSMATSSIASLPIYAFIGDDGQVVYTVNFDDENIQFLLGSHIRPKNTFITSFYKSLDTFEGILINSASTPVHTAQFKIIDEDEYGYYTHNELLTFPTTNGGYNLAVDGPAYNLYLNRLMEIGEFYDERFSDNIWRSMTHEVIKNLDWSYAKNDDEFKSKGYEDGFGRMTKNIRVMGRYFDSLRVYIDALKETNSISYSNDTNQLPDYFISDKLEEYGWDAAQIQPYKLKIYTSYDNNAIGYGEPKIEDEKRNKITINTGFEETVHNTRGASFDLIPGIYTFTADIDTSEMVEGEYFLFVDVDRPEEYTVLELTFFGDTKISGEFTIYGESSGPYRCNFGFWDNTGITDCHVTATTLTVKEKDKDVDFSIIRKFYTDYATETVKPYKITDDEGNDRTLMPSYDCAGDEIIWGDRDIITDPDSGLFVREIKKYGSNNEYTYPEINTEFLRRLTLNSKNILRKKGTINGIESVLSMFGMKSKTFVEKSKAKQLRYDYDIKENVIVVDSPLIDDKDYISGAEYQYEYINTMKDIVYDNDEFIQGQIVPYEGLPVIYYENEEEHKRYIYPNFDFFEEYDGNPYYQMKGGWLKKSPYTFDVDDNIVNAETISDVYTETSKDVRTVENIEELINIPYYELSDGDIVHVKDTTGLYVIVDGTLYELIEDRSETTVKYYFSVTVDGSIVTIGNTYFEDTITVSDLNVNGGKKKYVLTNDAMNGQDIRIYVDVYADENIMAAYSNVQSVSVVSLYDGTINDSSLTDYFVIRNAYSAGEISENGWRRIKTTDDEYFLINNLRNNYEGNNPHRGNMNYDSGEEYFSYFTKLFKYAIEDNHFSERLYETYEEDTDSIIESFGFTIDGSDVNNQCGFGYGTSLKEGNGYSNDTNGKEYNNLYHNNHKILIECDKHPLKTFVDPDTGKYHYGDEPDLYNGVCKKVNVKDYMQDKSLGVNTYGGLFGDRVINTKVIDITFYLNAEFPYSITYNTSGDKEHVVKSDKPYTVDGQCMIKYIEECIMPYVTQMIPSSTICRVHYKPYDNSQDYFTMVVKTAGNIRWSGSTTDNILYYSKDNGTTWTSANSATTISVVEGDKILWKGTTTPQTGYGIGKFTGATNVEYKIEGNVMSLLYGDNFKGQTSLKGKNYAFYGLFTNNTRVISAENLSLPATTLANRCYAQMFYGCRNLTDAPELPAITLAVSCYSSMFQDCKSLTKAPELPATTSEDMCYYNMFAGCSSLTTAPSILPATTLKEECCYNMFNSCSSLTTVPELPATTLALNCYRAMFYNCSSLTTAPELPATTLATGCYMDMFRGCTSIKTAPELPATTLELQCYYQMFSGCTSLTTAPSILPATTLPNWCYYNMFAGCSSLTTVPELPATTLANRCYYGMFRGCASITTAPVLPATTLEERCYNSMFSGCTRLTAITCLATDISASYCTNNWVNGVAANGTFTKVANMRKWTEGGNGIPTGWYVKNYPHDYSQDYFTMVVTTAGNIKWIGPTTSNTLYYSKNDGKNWSAVTSTDTIPVVKNDVLLWKGTAIPQEGYGIGKFSGDTNVRYEVEGNIMSLLFSDNFKGQINLRGKNYAFYNLFSGNTNVTSAENLSLPATTLEERCYYYMFDGCTNLTKAPELPATTLADYCYSDMFYGCTGLTTAPELPATTLADSCYNSMFSGCTSLTTAPSILPATTLKTYCYAYMFQGCSSLTTAPELPATTLADFCYQDMFSSCTSLTTAPELPATRLANYCYYNMFRGCTSIKTAPELPATTLANLCYYNMFSGCTSLTTAPELPARRLSNWCYYNMFNGCTSLETVPSVLPSTTLTNRCYYGMFRGCTSLATAPELPATTLTDYCYYGMFWGCTSLRSIKCLATDISAQSCTYNWVNGVAANGTFTKNWGITKESWGYGPNGIPNNNWTVVDA